MRAQSDSFNPAGRPMEARLVSDLPEGEGWQFEPKWDGFRALARRDCADVTLQSKSGKSLARYFPEIVAALASLACTRFVLDGELILTIGDTLSFDALQQRLHPAASRIAKLSRETPAQMMLFDCLAAGDRDLADAPLSERREALEALYRANRNPLLRLSPRTTDAAEARQWLARSGGALDGIIAKRIDAPYAWGERAMAKLKQHRSADCVVGGFRRADDGTVASLLLGLYDDAGALDHVGFTGKAPGGPSRWNNGVEKPWEPLRPELVVEVRYDQVTGGRFRHGTRLLRWRPDKAPDQCTMDQLSRALNPAELDAVLETHE
jgi:ATP-dependent DNA ligase